MERSTSRITTCAIAWGFLVALLSYLAEEKMHVRPTTVLAGGVGLLAGAVIGAGGEIVRALQEQGRRPRERVRPEETIPPRIGTEPETGIQTDMPPQRPGASGPNA